MATSHSLWRAYGEDRRAFERLLSLPHAFIFHRDYYEKGAGQAFRDEYMALRRRFSEHQERELIHLLSGPTEATGLRRDHYQCLARDRGIDSLIRRVLRFHILDTKDGPMANGLSDLPRFLAFDSDFGMPEQSEIVEDAGLFDHEYVLEQDDQHRVKTAD